MREKNEFNFAAAIDEKEVTARTIWRRDGQERIL